MSEPQAQRIGRKYSTIGVCLALTLIVWIVFGQTLGHPFVNFDDDVYVYENSEVSRGLTSSGIKWLLTQSHARLWHPLTTLSHMLDCQLYSLRPSGHHFTNVALHNLGAVLLFLVFRGMTGAFWRSAFVAAIFAVHPMRVESVAWVAERKDVLSGFFFFLTLGAYVGYVRHPGVARYLMMSALFVCALLSKATVVTVPILLLLLDYWPLNRSQKSRLRPEATARQADLTGQRSENAATWWKLVAEKIPLLALTAASSIVTASVQIVTMASLAQLPLLPRLKNAAVSVVIYLKQMFWPTDLAVFYPHPHDQLNLWLVLVSVAVIAGLSVASWVVRRSYPYVLVGWLWYLLLLLPVLGIVQAGLQGRADRFTYLPHIGITMMVSWTITDLTRGWQNRRAMVTAMATLAIMLLIVLAAWQTTYWRDSISLWRHALAVTSNNQTAHENLAAALWARGNKEESRVQSRLAAIVHAETILKDYPDDVATRDDLGVWLVHSRDPRGAVEQWERSLATDPNDANAQNNLAWVLATYPDDTIRDGKRAVALAKNALSFRGGETLMVRRTLAAAYAEAGDFPSAIATVEDTVILANLQKNISLVKTLQHELELYRSHQPYRELPPE